VVVFGVYRISAGELSVGALVACSILAARAVAPLSQAAGILGRWQHTRVAMEGLDQLMKAPLERPQDKRFVRKERLAGHYRLEALKLAHGENPPAVDIAALEIRPGERIALLGGNGAGKSTLLRLLAGFYDAQSGRLLLDDVAIAQIDPSDRRRQVGYLPQDVALFYGTLRDNLNLEGAATSDEDMFEALDGVGLGDFVRSHPLGLDLPLLGNGSLSGGQRQAVGLARVLLQDPPVVLLDEPTASFDQSTELHVIGYLQRWLEGRTLVMTTHKKTMLAVASRAVVLSQGKVVMDGALDQIVKDRTVQIPGQNPGQEGGVHGQ
jgi:ABC-type bacteriocin/lantibiotic exporters, contain an N-terminal double-glycine peptidase domain